MLDDLAGVHDDDAVGELGDEAEVVRDEDDRGVRLLLRRLHDLDDLRLDRHVERGRRLVGDEHLGSFAIAIAIIAALPHPAGELVRVLVDALLGEGHADELEQLDRALARAASSFMFWLCVRTASAIWSPTVSTGFSDVIGSWKIIAISPPRRSRSSLCDIVRRSRPLYSASPGVDAARRHGNEAEHRHHRDALPRSRLADDAEHLALERS